MKNQSFYAFYPKDFDPRNEPNFKIDSGHAIRDRVSKIQRTSPQDHPAFNVLANALYDWATE